MNGEFAGRRVVVMGLGRFGGGIGVSRWLARQGARVVVSDQADESTLAASIAQLAGLGVTFRCGRHDEADLDGADLLVVSPAVDKKKSPFVQAAQRRGIRATSEMNLFLERCAGFVVGVTGTAGKSTTASMLNAILALASSKRELSDRGVRLGGNIGQSLLGELAEIRSGDLVVLELSSFQLEDAAALPWSSPFALITNVSPNHLDRHESLDAYLSCKLNICREQRRGDLVILGSNDARLDHALGAMAARTGARVLKAPVDIGVNLRIPGLHNRRNAALAGAAAGHLGTTWKTIREALEAFNGLPHRLQFAGVVEGVRYYNDSKATTPGGVAVALESFAHPVILIAGGQEKGTSWAPVAGIRSARIKRAICTGENRRRVAGELGGTEAATVEEAVTAARQCASTGDVVLFSPGSPSYDQFVNYEARGDVFMRLIESM